MWYIIGQVLVCLLLTAAIGVLAGWLARGYHARAELTSMQRQLQRQARDLRGRTSPPAAKKAPISDEEKRVQQQLRHQLVRLQGQLQQREKEIAQLRRVLGEQRLERKATGGAGARRPSSPSSSPPSSPPSGPSGPGDATRKRKPG